MENPKVFEIYPSWREPMNTAYIVAVIYLICFIVGLCGNTSMLTMIWTSNKLTNNIQHSSVVMKRRRSSVGCRNGGDNVRIYVIALCIIDTIMLLSLPSTIADSLVGFWMFGTLACKIHHVFSSVGRVASTFLITAMSVDRYIAIAKPHGLLGRTTKKNILIVFTLLFIAFLLLSPLLVYAESQKHVVQNKTMIEQNMTIVIRYYKCVDGMPENLLLWFTGSTFIIGYFIPMIAILVVNTKLILKIRTHQREISVKSVIPFKRLTIYNIALAFIYFACWTPYWMSILYVSYADLFGSGAIAEFVSDSKSTIMLIYCIHIFPYINTSVNWFFYGRLANNQSRNSSYINNNVCPPNNGNFEKSELFNSFANHELTPIADNKKKNGNGSRML
uniref:G_PROTEIN_RECEP_F1_2 domain-containing protein n=1 Tax=Rhabditophanes sp. KR3021 TaxID=114890 RepID=A0AC35U044_9BILA